MRFEICLKSKHLVISIAASLLVAYSLGICSPKQRSPEKLPESTSSDAFLSETSSSAVNSSAAHLPMSNQVPTQPSQRVYSLSRFGFFAELAPGLAFRSYTDVQVLINDILIFPGIGATFLAVDSCHPGQQSFCWQLQIAAKFSVDYAIDSRDILVSPIMAGARAILFFGHQNWVGLHADLMLGYAFSPIITFGNPHFARLDFGAGLWFNLQRQPSRLAITLTANYDPISKLLTFPVGLSVRF